MKCSVRCGGTDMEIQEESKHGAGLWRRAAPPQSTEEEQERHTAGNGSAGREKAHCLSHTHTH